MADEISTETVIGQLRAVLKEGFEGPKNQWSYFTEAEPESGLFGTLAKLSAAEASRPWGGTTIAAHTHHVAFGLEASSAWIQGDREPRDWPASWSVTTVDDAAWASLQEELRSRYQDLREAFKSHAADSIESLGAAVGAIAHVAYHLGAIRQKVAASRES
jgi:hypothetical protein